MQEIIQRNSKAKLGNYFIVCTGQNILQKIYIKVRLTLFKNWNNLYEH